MKAAKKTVKKSLSAKPGTVISNCTVDTTIWDAKAVEAIQTVAQGLLNLTELFKSQGIEIHGIHISGADVQTGK